MLVADFGPRACAFRWVAWPLAVRASTVFSSKVSIFQHVNLKQRIELTKMTFNQYVLNFLASLPSHYTSRKYHLPLTQDLDAKKMCPFGKSKKKKNVDFITRFQTYKALEASDYLMIDSRSRDWKFLQVIRLYRFCNALLGHTLALRK